GKIRTGLCIERRPRAVNYSHLGMTVSYFGATQIDAALIGHFQEQQVSQLLDVVAVINAFVPKRMAKAPKFLNDISHAATARLSCLISSGICPGKTLTTLPQPPKRVKIGSVSKSSLSMDKFCLRCARIRTNHCCCSAVKVLPSVISVNARLTRSSAV